MSDGYSYPGRLAQGQQRGRGAQLNPPNRYESVRLEVLGEFLDEQAAANGSDSEGGTVGAAGGGGISEARRVPTRVYVDRTRTIINSIDSPDIGFKWSINPYRGCEHGCIYCYARPDHERLGFSCGLEFETQIVAKMNAADLLRKELARPSWKGEPILMSGVTDCYQPLEKKLELTRRCLAVMRACRQPVSIVTKNRLILRDVDALAELAGVGAARVAVSITTLDPHLAGLMEPRASSPADRIEAIRRLSAAGVPTTVMVAPVIPGLTDREMPRILQAAADAGASSAGYVLLRLPHQVKTLFVDWLGRHRPERAGHVLGLLRQSRGGKLYDAAYSCRMKGEGEFAGQIGEMFKVFRTRCGLDLPTAELSSAAFRHPQPDGQMMLF